MNPSVTYLVSIIYNEILFRVAVHVNDRNKIPVDMDYPMEPECREWLSAQFPEYLKKCPIVDVQGINKFVEVTLF